MSNVPEIKGQSAAAKWLQLRRQTDSAAECCAMFAALTAPPQPPKPELAAPEKGKRKKGKQG